MCLPIIGAVISGIGTAVSAMMSAAQYKAQAQLHEREAKIQDETGRYKADLAQRDAERAFGTQRASAVASGIDISTGSENDLAMANSMEAQRDINAIRWNHTAQADNNRYEAKVARMNAGNQGITAALGFLTPVIQGVARYKSQFS